jgi:putative transport protein
MAIQFSPILALFLVIGTGIIFGRFKFFGIKLGVAGVLFTGLAAGAVAPQLMLPEIVTEIGLILFVYTVGLEAGPQCIEIIRSRGLKDSLLAALVIVLITLCAWAVGVCLGFEPALRAGLFCGAFTNTPALAAVREALNTVSSSAKELSVVSYSLTYPIGVLGVVFAIELYRRVFQISIPSAQEEDLLSVRNFLVSNPAVFGRSVTEISKASRSQGFIISRIKRGESVQMAQGRAVLQEGDVVAVVGDEQGFQEATLLFGSLSGEHLEHDRDTLDYRRVFVSNKAVEGRTLAELALYEKFGAIVTRIKRGDRDFVPDGSTHIEMGDRVRVLSSKERFKDIARYFGDSIKGAAAADYGIMALGMSIGVIVGMIPMTLPGGLTVRLGLAGGTIITAIVLSSCKWPTRVTWTVPLAVNLTLREFGLLLFLSGVGVRAGHEFVSGLHNFGLFVIPAGALLTVTASLVFLYICERMGKVPFDFVLGMLSALHTQPSIFAYVREIAPSDAASRGYASIYPVATILKILCAQALLHLP